MLGYVNGGREEKKWKIQDEFLKKKRRQEHTEIRGNVEKKKMMNTGEFIYENEKNLKMKKNSKTGRSISSQCYN